MLSSIDDTNAGWLCRTKLRLEKKQERLKHNSFYFYALWFIVSLLSFPLLLKMAFYCLIERNRSFNPSIIGVSCRVKLLQILQNHYNRLRIQSGVRSAQGVHNACSACSPGHALQGAHATLVHEQLRCTPREPRGRAYLGALP